MKYWFVSAWLCRRAAVTSSAVEWWWSIVRRTDSAVGDWEYDCQHQLWSRRLANTQLRPAALVQVRSMQSYVCLSLDLVIIADANLANSIAVSRTVWVVCIVLCGWSPWVVGHLWRFTDGVSMGDFMIILLLLISWAENSNFRNIFRCENGFGQSNLNYWVFSSAGERAMP